MPLDPNKIDPSSPMLVSAIAVATPFVFDHSNRRRYPPSSNHREAGQPFLVPAQHFSQNNMRLAPGSQFTVEDVLAYKTAYNKANPDRFKSEIQKPRKPYVKPIDLGLEETAPKELGPKATTLKEMQEVKTPVVGPTESGAPFVAPRRGPGRPPKQDTGVL